MTKQNSQKRHHSFFSEYLQIFLPHGHHSVGIFSLALELNARRHSLIKVTWGPTLKLLPGLIPQLKFT